MRCCLINKNSYAYYGPETLHDINAVYDYIYVLYNNNNVCVY